MQFRRILWPGDEPGQIVAKHTREYRARNRTTPWEGADALFVNDRTSAKWMTRNGIPEEVEIEKMTTTHFAALDPETAKAVRSGVIGNRSGTHETGAAL